MATTPTLTGSAFFSAGVAQLRAAALTTEDYANAFQSLVSIDPSAPALVQQQSAANVSPDLAYFQLAPDGTPALVVPSNSPSFSFSPATSLTPATAGGDLSAALPAAGTTPGAITVPAGAPCPQGFVTSPATTDVQVRAALALLPPPQDTTIAGACVPAPTVAAIGQWITADDFLRVTVLTSVTTSGLTLTARVLDCQGVTHYLTDSLDGVALNTAKTFIMSLTPGYLLSVSASDMGSALTTGQTFVSLGLQYASQTGTAPELILAQGYVTGLYAVSWPATVSGAPAPVTIAPTTAAAVAVVQSRANGTNDGITIAVTLGQNVTGGNCLVAMVIFNYVNDPVTLTDNQSNAWTKIHRDTATHYEMWIAANVAPGSTTVTYTMTGPYTFSLQMQVVEFSGLDITTPADVSASVYNTNPLTATTPATTYGDVGVVLYGGLVTGASGAGVPGGWNVILDSQTPDTRRIVSLWSSNQTTPPATWSFTGYLGYSANAVIIAALHVKGG